MASASVSRSIRSMLSWTCSLELGRFVVQALLELLDMHDVARPGRKVLDLQFQHLAENDRRLGAGRTGIHIGHEMPVHVIE